MLIHLGNNEFVDLANAEAILNLSTIDHASKTRILKRLPVEIRSDARTAILCTDGTWRASTISPEALVNRGGVHPFSKSSYLNRRLIKVYRRRARG